MEKLNSEPAGPSIRGECGYRDGLSEVSVFRTRDGLVGFYQLRGLADADGRGVNIRYKLVLGGSPNAPFVVSPDTTQSAPIPVPVVTRNIPALVPIGGILLLLVGGIAVIVLAVRKSKLGAGRTMAIGCGVIMLGFVLVLLLFAVLSMGKTIQAAATRWSVQHARLQSARFAAPVGTNCSFGPVIERVLPFDRSAIDFQTGKIIRPDWEKLPDQNAVERWMSESGVDAIAEDVPAQPIGDGRGYPELMALGGNSGKERCVFVREEAAEFDSARAADADGKLKIVAEQDLYWGFANSCGSQPWWFRTVDGATGILQLLGTTDNPRGVKIRYKLVQGGATNAAAVAPPLSFGPVIEREVNDLQTSRENCALNFDTGKLLPVPANISSDFLSIRANNMRTNPPAESVALATAQKQDEAVAWAQSNQVDAVAFVTADTSNIDKSGLLCPDVLAIRTGNGAWNQATPALLEQEFVRVASQLGLDRLVEEITSDDNFPTTYLILDTRTPRKGVLQILGVADNPLRVKLRYKLVQSAASKNSDAK